MRGLMKSVFCGVAVVALAQGYPIHASAPRQPFTMTISTAQNVFKSGSEISLKLIFTNTSEHDILLVRRIDGTEPMVAAVPVEVHVDGEKGNAPPETKYLRMLRGEDLGEDYVFSGIGASLPTAKKSEERVIVNKFYDLSKPGKYKIQLQWTDRTSKTVVKSNTITVTVTQ